MGQCRTMATNRNCATYAVVGPPDYRYRRAWVGARVSHTQVLFQHKDDHFLMGHVVHGVGDAADAIARLAASGKRHPVRPKRRMVVDKDGRCI